MTTAAPAAPAAPPGLLPTLGAALPLLAGIGLLMLGNGLTGTLLGIRAGLEGFNPTVTGLVLSAYYAGFIAGSVISPSTIYRVGHIRAFAGLASLASAVVLIHVVRPDPLSWMLLRALSGLCISGLFVITETWLNGAASNATRGRLLSTYMIVLTGGIGGGQLLLTVTDPAGFGVFVLASVLVSLAVVPVVLTSVVAPAVPDPVPMSMARVFATAPLAVAGAAAAGFVGGAVVGAGAVYASQAGLGAEATALLIAGALAFALVVQLPLGRASDRVDRRRVIGLVSAAGALMSVAAAAVGPDPFLLLLGCVSVAGGLSYPLYSLSNAHLNDYLHGGAVAAAGARMVLINGAGAIAGPMVSTAAIDAFGAGGFFVVVAACYALAAGYTLVRLARRPPAPEAERATFLPLSPGTATTVATLVPEASAELYPLTSGDLDNDGVRLRWHERGAGPPVVIVHDAGSSSDSWESVALGLVATGYRVVMWDLRGHGASGPGPTYTLEDHLGDLAALLSDRSIACAHLVGHGAGGGIVAAFVLGCPERVDSAVLVSMDESLASEGSGRAVERAVGGALRAVRRARPGRRGGGRRDRPADHQRALRADRQRARSEAVVKTRQSVRRGLATADLSELTHPVLWVRNGRLGQSGSEQDVVFAESGHFVQLERPDDLADVILGFLHSLSPSETEWLAGNGSRVGHRGQHP